MDSNRLKEAYQRLKALDERLQNGAAQLEETHQRFEYLDERLRYKIKPRSSTMTSPSVDQVDAKLRELATYTLELKDIVADAKLGELATYTLELKDIMKDFMLAFARVKKRPDQ